MLRDLLLHKDVIFLTDDDWCHFTNPPLTSFRNPPFKMPDDMGPCRYLRRRNIAFEHFEAFTAEPVRIITSDAPVIDVFRIYREFD